jgi:hypothetical protein
VGLASRLSGNGDPVIVRRVKFSRLLLLSLAVLLLASCASYFERSNAPYRKYYRVRVTNVRGEIVADWVAEGRVAKTERGYAFRAVERTSAPPFMTNTRFPHGRKVSIGGANIVVTPADKPYWLFEMDRF